MAKVTVLNNEANNVNINVPAPTIVTVTDKGQKGDAATISVGTVTTLSAGQAAVIVNSGTTKDAVFDFSVPTGPQGTQGAQGATGDTGAQGIQGIQGVQGVAGVGVPAGGTTGQALVKTDATDYNTEWSVIDSSPWTTTGNDLYYNTGNVGIGTSSPSEKLSVAGNISVTGTVDGVDIAALDTEVTANTAKVGITSSQASAITANTAKVGITSTQANAITANTAKVGITSTQASDITANNAKVGITSGQASAITANTAKTGITSGQASAITANTAKVGFTNALADARIAAASISALSDVPSIGTAGQVLVVNSGATALEYANQTGGGGSGGIGTADQTLDADRTIDTNGFNLDIELDPTGTADTFTIHDGTHDLFQVDTTTTGELFSVNDVSGLPKLTVHDTDGVTIPKLNHYKAFLGGKGLNTSNSTYGTQWRGSMSGGSQGRFSASADSSIITYSGTPAVGATVAGNNYKLATSMLLPGIKFSTIDYKGSLRAYDADCDGETQNIEIWTCDDYNDLAGYGTTTLTYRGGNSYTYDAASATIKPIVVSNAISFAGTDTTGIFVFSHTPTNPAGSMEFVFNLEFTIS